MSVGELLSGLGSHREVGALKRRLTRGEGKRRKLLEPPLPKPQAERVSELGGGGRGERGGRGRGGREQVERHEGRRKGKEEWVGRLSWYM